MAEPFVSGLAGGLAIVVMLFVWGYGGALVLQIGIPVLISGCGWIARCFGLTLMLLLRSIAAGMSAIGRGASAGALFLRLFIEEWWRGDQPDADAETDNVDDDDFRDEDADLAAYDVARRLLGLPAEFTPSDLRRAYRAAIAGAHPDKGGREDDAQAVNVARDVIRRVRGWA